MHAHLGSVRLLKTQQYCAHIMLYVGTFLVNSVPALVLFDSGASRSFVSSAFSQHISVSREALSRPLRVSIAKERVIYAT